MSPRSSSGYSSGADTLYFVAVEFDGVSDLLETLQHELLVHNGLGFVEPELLQSFLRSIRTTAKDSPELARIVEEVERVEGDRTEAVQAEEILARIAQDRLSLPDKLWNRLVLALQRLLRKAGFNVESSARRRGKDLIYRIGDAFAEGKRAGRRDMTGLMNSAEGNSLMWPRSQGARLISPKAWILLRPPESITGTTFREGLA